MAIGTGEVQRLSNELLGRIVSGAYPAGLRLPSEADLASEFSCGRSTVREALRVLTGLGVVQSRRGSGAMVLDFRREGTPALLPVFLQLGRFDRPATTIATELLRIRTQMAGEAVRLAARYASPDDLNEARQLLARAPELEADPVAHAGHELELYRALVAASGIWPAAWLVNSFWGPLREIHRLLGPVLRPVRADFQSTMERLLEIIQSGDESKAVALVHRWFASIDAELIGVLERGLSLARGSDRDRGPNN